MMDELDNLIEIIGPETSARIFESEGDGIGQPIKSPEYSETRKGNKKKGANHPVLVRQQALFGLIAEAKLGSIKIEWEREMGNVAKIYTAGTVSCETICEEIPEEEELYRLAKDKRDLPNLTIQSREKWAREMRRMAEKLLLEDTYKRYDFLQGVRSAHNTKEYEATQKQAAFLQEEFTRLSTLRTYVRYGHRTMDKHTDPDMFSIKDGALITHFPKEAWISYPIAQSIWGASYVDIESIEKVMREVSRDHKKIAGYSLMQDDTVKDKPFNYKLLTQLIGEVGAVQENENALEEI